MNILHTIIENGLPYIICILEIMGVIVISISAVFAFLQYFQNAFLKKQLDIQTTFSKSLLTGLEFLMTGEIFKTILIQSMEEIFVLSGIVVLRIALAILLHFETRSNHKKKELENASGTDSADKKALDGGENATKDIK